MRFALMLGAGCVVLAGCGSPQPERTPVQGKVTFEGKPVVYGVVNISPDWTRGNKGVFGAGEINDGVFESNPGYAPSPGSVLVSIQVFDGKPPGNKLIALIPDYSTEIPPGAAAWDLNLTAKDVKALK